MPTVSKEIEYLVNQGVISGYPDGKFRPNQPITRQQVAAMLVKALKLDVKNRPNPGFKDVSKNAYYYSAIAAVADERIIRGANGKFMPSEFVTRAQMAAIIRRAFELKQSWTQQYLDVEKNYWAYSDINAMYENGIASGNSGKGHNHFAPDDVNTRGQFSVFLARALNSKLTMPRYMNGINFEPSLPVQQVGKWKFDLTSEKLIAINVETGEEIQMFEEGQVTTSMKSSLQYHSNNQMSFDDVVIEFDEEADLGLVKRSYGDLLIFPILLKGSAFSESIRTYLAVELDSNQIIDPSRKFYQYETYFLTNLQHSKFNLHGIVTWRYLSNVRPVGNGDVKVGYYYANTPIVDIVIKDDRVAHGHLTPNLRDFQSIQVDGSRIFYCNSTGFYSMYHDGSQRKQLLEGTVQSFKIEGTTIFVNMVSGEQYKLNYTGSSVEKVLN